MDSTNRRNYWKVALVLAGLSSLVQSQASQLSSNANVPVREIAAKVGSPANFTCGSNGVPIISCIWERQNDKLTVTIISDFAIAGTTSNPAYGYVGGGFDAGACGLLIKNVKEDDNSVWNCKLITPKGYLYQGDVRVGILKKPNKPVFSTNVEQIKNLSDPEEHNVKVSVTCGSNGGQPPPQFKWFIGNDEITENLEPIESSIYNGENWIHQTLTGHKFTAKDNEKELRCVLVHDALSDSDEKEVSEKIVVNYGPKADVPINPKFVQEMGQDVTLTINISSNPIPEKVVWRVGHTLIHPMQSRDKYTAFKLVQVSPGVYAAGLLIKNVEEEDLTKVYQVETTNSYGTATFDLRLSSNDPGAGGGLSAGGIIGLVLGIPALLILIAVIVVYTRARGLLCFKGDDGTASEKERMDGESGAGVGAEEKPVTVTQSLSSRLSAIYENLVAKKKDKGAPTTEDDVNKPEKEGIPVQESPQEKKPEDIVYAELDLVNETGGGKPVVRCADDKTEYAEIVGVVPLGGTLEEPKNKSPAGSLSASPKK